MLVLAWTFFQGIDGLVTFYMSNELGASGGSIGLYGTIKGVGILAGGVGLAAVVRRGGRRIAAVTTIVAVTIGGVTFASLDSIDAIIAVAPLWGIVVGLQWTNYVTFTMGLTDLRIIGIGAGEGIATALSNDVGFDGVFRMFAVANLVVLPLMLFVVSRFSSRLPEDVIPT